VSNVHNQLEPDCLMTEWSRLRYLDFVPRTCVIRMFLRTVTGSHWRCFYFRSTSVFSALEVFFTRNALYKFTFDIDKPTVESSLVSASMTNKKQTRNKSITSKAMQNQHT